MFVERLMNQTNAPLLEKVLQFTAARHRLIAENIANVDTPGYVQKDLDVRRFNAMLGRHVEERERGGEAGDIGFDEIAAEVEHPARGILFHDGNNRSMEQLASDLAKNAMLHNMVIELLRKQFQQMDMALKEKVT
jgi:flagellar basal-body rod protein FlgB